MINNISSPNSILLHSFHKFLLVYIFQAVSQFDINFCNMAFDSICSPRLSLGLGSSYHTNDRNHHLQFPHQEKSKSPPKFSHQSLPSLTLGLSTEITHQATEKIDVKGDSSYMHGQASSACAVSSFSNSSVKREREVSVEEVEVEKVSSKAGDEQDEEGPRKKLRLTKEQSLILEDSFKEHSTLNPKQKQALAERLNLRPRQVEVWFQNRRARTKLKQTEVDYEMLKKRCETLKEENRRLHKELQDLEIIKLTAPLYMQLPSATLTMCPSCERITSSDEKPPEISFTKPHFYSPFANPSEAF